MLNSDILEKKLQGIDGQDYGAYQSLLGEYMYEHFSLIIHQIPKDPYAPPHTGIYRIKMNRRNDQIINFDYKSKIQQTAFRDFLARRFNDASKFTAAKRRGTGYSGIITINEPGQAILERSCVVVEQDIIEVRCFIGLPAAGRKIKSQLAQKMLLEELPAIVEHAFFAKNINTETLKKHVQTAQDSEFLRDKLESLGLIAFIRDGALLPRESGESNKPLSAKEAILFISPPQLRKEITLPLHGKISGMGIPKGITLIVGGGYHGKSTLLNAIELGIYNHVPGDGRELCVSLPQTVKIRSYSGRYIVKTDISPFIRNLPFKKDTTAFSTPNASGSTSQAAGIMEAIEVGATVLLMDEDTCATNFMIRDSKMQQLVNKNDEPITTFIDRVRTLYEQKNISSVLVLGGAGDYFEVADHVIQMKTYQPNDVTNMAIQISAQSPQKREKEDTNYPFHFTKRIPVADSINPYNDYGKKGIYAKEVNRINFGKYIIDLTDLEQLVELSQTRAIAFALDYATKHMDKKLSLKEVIDIIEKEIAEHGLDILSERLSANFARFRSFELAFTLNRLRGLDVEQKKSE